MSNEQPNDEEREGIVGRLSRRDAMAAGLAGAAGVMGVSQASSDVAAQSDAPRLKLGDEWELDDSGDVLTATYTGSGNGTFDVDVMNAEQGSIGSLDTDNGAIRREFNHDVTISSPSYSRAINHVDWASGWTRIDNVITASITAHKQPEMVYWHDPGSDYHGNVYCTYEYTYQPNDFRIGILEGNNWIDGETTPEWHTATEPLVSESGSAGDPDEVGVADATVIPPGHFDDDVGRMWIDMEDGSGTWYLGVVHIDSGDDPMDAANWTKQDFDSDGVTDAVLSPSRGPRFDDGIVHNPEAVLYDGKPLVFYGATSSSDHQPGFQTGLAKPADDAMRGDDLYSWGQVTNVDTSTVEDQIRLKTPVTIGGTIVALMNKDSVNPVLGASTDGGRTWEQVTDNFASGRLYSLISDTSGQLWGIQDYGDPSNVSMFYKEVAL